MATIGQLLERLESQIQDLDWTPQDPVGAHAAGWMALAKATGQAITLLPLGGRSDLVKAGIRNVLAPLAHGPRRSVTDLIAAPHLVELTTTVGAISDSLAGILRWGPRPEQVGTPALGLEAGLLSALHVAAQWSRAAVEAQCLGARRPSLATFLGDLIVVTEPFALISPQNRVSTLNDLAFIAPSNSGLDGTVALWAEVSRTVLGDRYWVSSWALQVIAADLALISQSVRRSFVAAEALGPAERAARASALTTLDVARRSWLRAAAWPPYLRLGGRNADLRSASRDLREAVTNDPTFSTAQGRRLLGLAVPVGTAHVRCLGVLTRKRELWIHAPFLVPDVPYERGWIREPSWSGEGRDLLLSAEEGQDALDRALAGLGVEAAVDRVRGERPRWRPDSPCGTPQRDPDREAARAMDHGRPPSVY